MSAAGIPPPPQPEWEEGDDAGNTLDVAEDFELDLLPPPAVALPEEPEGFGPLPTELWQRVAPYLDPLALCRADLVATGCRHPAAFEAELWARLCSVHFPTMYSSVLADHGMAQVECTAGGPPPNDATPSSGKSKGKRGSRCGGGGGGSRAVGSRTPWWRRQSGSRSRADGELSLGDLSPGDLSPSLFEQDADSRDGTELLLPLPSPEASPRMMPVSPSMPALRSDLSPDFGLALRLPEASAPETPICRPSAGLLCPSPASPDKSIGRLADWRSLYARRHAKKAQWDSQKRDKDAPAPSGEAQPRRISELSRRELGKLSDAAHRLKVCTLCGEKYSPGEARKDATGCCFHPGDYGPADPQGWRRDELKQLRQYARHALKNAGGASWVQRHPRASKGHGHWLKGLGMYASDKVKFRRCLEGEVPGTWSCCGGKELFAEGCQRGPHRHF